MTFSNIIDEMIRISLTMPIGFSRLATSRDHCVTSFATTAEENADDPGDALSTSAAWHLPSSQGSIPHEATAPYMPLNPSKEGFPCDKPSGARISQVVWAVATAAVALHGCLEVVFVPRAAVANVNRWGRQHITDLRPFARPRVPGC
jgi:hypothetical protein